ncbi:carbamoyltransferase [Oleiphilus messinensis]|uniref:Carbamoyltransferase n=1 Tax=Oleiphilus messinensis TaxID=141451 RepID=A0A1Y0I4J1_9GAMM|nr:carbamoyltransferase [Oleiphilus messinensis]ARU54374.1 carbamoyltransferase [Oleiphilus messinensis]
MIILGISAYYHDSAAAIIQHGKIIAAAQEERFSRIKHDSSFPVQAIEYCLFANQITLDQVDHIVFYEKPFLKFERLLETYLSFAPRGFVSFAKAMPVWLKEKLFQRTLLENELKHISQKEDYQAPLLFSEHHLSHAASAFYPSPFTKALILTMDGVGEWATTSLAVGDGTSIKIVKEIHFPHSLGLLYSAFTYYLGFKVNSGEYKVMGLAPYGKPVYKQLILDNIIDVKPDGSYRLNMEYFNYCTGLTMTSPKFHKLFKSAPRKPESELTQFDMDVAASAQAVIEEIVLKLTSSIAKEFRIPNLCLAGGVALNCVANGRILQSNEFENIWVQPASGDAGGALGAALLAYHMHCEQPRLPARSNADKMHGSYLGPDFCQEKIERTLTEIGAVFDIMEDDALIQRGARLLSEQNVVGWFQGRMEFGPRALGSRSILADPRSPDMQSTLNQKIKFRESFRPFAPSVLAEHASAWFDITCASPYMQFVVNVLPNSETEQNNGHVEHHRTKLPAITHVDNTARVQSVHSETNPRFHKLLTEFYRLTACPVLINTSFNIRGEPIVCTPLDAFHCFMGTNMDYLIIGNCVLSKSEQTQDHKQSYIDRFALD